jgi:hypothetical protein
VGLGMNGSNCTCGKTEPHTIARRSTADGTSVYLWDDGALTWPLGRYIEGGMHPRTPEQRERARQVGRLVLGDVGLYADAEVSELIAAARWTAERDGLPGTMRDRFWSERRKAGMLKPVWVVQSADRDGKPTSRVWELPRLSGWTGAAVWDERTSAGRYHLHYRISGSRSADPTYGPAVFSFKTLGALLAWMAENAPKKVESNQ